MTIRRFTGTPNSVLIIETRRNCRNEWPTRSMKLELVFMIVDNTGPYICKLFSCCCLEHVFRTEVDVVDFSFRYSLAVNLACPSRGQLADTQDISRHGIHRRGSHEHQQYLGLSWSGSSQCHEHLCLPAIFIGYWEDGHQPKKAIKQMLLGRVSEFPTVVPLRQTCPEGSTLLS